MKVKVRFLRNINPRRDDFFAYINRPSSDKAQKGFVCLGVSLIGKFGWLQGGWNGHRGVVSLRMLLWWRSIVWTLELSLEVQRHLQWRVEQRRPSEFSCCRGTVQCKGLVLTLRLRQLQLCQFCGNNSRGC